MRSRNLIPIIRLRHCLLVSIQIELNDHLVDNLKESLARALKEERVTGLVIEVSGVDVFDSYIARAIRNLAHVAHMMGVHTVLAGLDPGMAITLVEMGMHMDLVETALDVDDALDVVARRAQAKLLDAEHLLEDLERPDRDLDAILGGS
jgi:rsbT antagonist protein RsbS